ncbi:MAG: hypothetical protein V7629_16630 [Motiliproteus sp.]
MQSAKSWIISRGQNPCRLRKVLHAAVLLLLVMLAGCSSPQLRTPLQTPLASASAIAAGDTCGPVLALLAQRIEAAGSADPLGYPIRPYPYLRVDRLLASFSAQLETDNQRQAWYQRLYRLGHRARQIELDNLSPPLAVALREQIEPCIQRQAIADRQAADFYQQLTASAQVPDLYSDWQQMLGAFPLTRLIVLHQIAQQQQRWRQDFNSARVLQGDSQHYRHPSNESLPAERIAAWLEQARSASPLGIPELDGGRQAALFDHFAPAWQVFTRSAADQIGSLYWRDGRPGVDGGDPVAYLLPSYTRFNGQVLLQLNYLVWFPERPSQRPLDLYAGLLDGLLWRVTLGMDGRVLLYDSIHPCGCYHRIFPVAAQLKAKPAVAGVEQPLIIPGVAPAREQGRLLLQLTAADHYLQGIALAAKSPPAPAEGGIKNYRFSRYQQLRSLASGNGRRNLFDADGLVAASARLERFLLWPMGVASAGAMRVWGAHAISFANRRYFDEPYLFEQFFDWQPD